MSRFRFLIFVVLAFVVGCAAGCEQRRSSIFTSGDSGGEAPTHAKLVQAEKAINENYFLNLPTGKITIVLKNMVDEHGERTLMGRSTERFDGSWLIEIDRDFNATEKQAEMTLIHEDCHVEDFIQNKDEGLDGHGEAFQTCMLNKAQDGIFRGLW